MVRAFPQETSDGQLRLPLEPKATVNFDNIHTPGLSPEEDGRFDELVERQGYSREEALLEIIGIPAPSRAVKQVPSRANLSTADAEAADAEAADAEFDRLDKMGISTALLIRRKARLQ